MNPTDKQPDETPSALQAFDETDWYAYGGVESKDPRIAHLAWGDVILDGSRVSAVLGDDEVTEFSRDLQSPAVAQLVAERLASIPNATPADIEQYLERI